MYFENPQGREASESDKKHTRKKFLASLEQMGINNLNTCYTKKVRNKDSKVPSQFFCPFSDCVRGFSETGNLKTHMRIHVSNCLTIYRLGNVPSSAITKTAQSSSSPKGT